jgi:hypothetical protein
MSLKFGSTLIHKAVYFLHSASASAAGAVILRHMGAHTALLPISSMPDDENQTANRALMCLINVHGNQENTHQRAGLAHYAHASRCYRRR